MRVKAIQHQEISRCVINFSLLIAQVFEKLKFIGQLQFINRLGIRQTEVYRTWVVCMKITVKFLLVISLMILSSTLPANGGYSVQNGRILDGNNNPIQLRGSNWFGFETHDHVVHGLWAREWKGMITQMKQVGLNAVRLPFCPGDFAKFFSYKHQLFTQSRSAK